MVNVDLCVVDVNLCCVDVVVVEVVVGWMLFMVLGGGVLFDCLVMMGGSLFGIVDYNLGVMFVYLFDLLGWIWCVIEVV